MRIVIAKGGLGNTMFQYALVLAFRSGVRTKDRTAALFVSKSNLSDHNGYELKSVFNNSEIRTVFACDLYDATT